MFFKSLKRLAVSKTENCCYSGLGVDKERKISSGDKRDNRIQGVMDRGQSLTQESANSKMKSINLKS